MFDEDKSISDIAKQKLSMTDSKEAKAALDSYLSMGKAAMSLLSSFLGTSMSQIFSSQEDRMKNKMKDFYEKAGKPWDPGY